MHPKNTVFRFALDDGRIVTIDAADALLVAPHHWYVTSGKGRPDYVVASLKGRAFYLHRFLMEAGPGMIVDHINGDTFDNRRANLRFVTHQQNMANSKRRRHNTMYKGVQIRCDGKKWVARIQVDRKMIHLGSFLTPEDAARAYDKAAILHFGEYARLNFPTSPESR